MNQLIACCGLDCEKCDTRIETLTNDNALREENAALWTKLNGVTITPEMLDLFVSEDDLQDTINFRKHYQRIQ